VFVRWSILGQMDTPTGPRYHVIQGDVHEVLVQLVRMGVGPFDALFCDPPYGISFMSRAWDHGVPSVEVWRAALELLRPGANVVAFGGTRTWHRLAIAIEDAGLEMRDSIIGWTYGSGWPKPADVAKYIDKAKGAKRKVTKTIPDQWSDKGSTYELAGSEQRVTIDRTDEPATQDAARFDGWHANLKPSWEPALMFRKPLEGGLATNALAHGVAGLNIDGCRIGTSKRVPGSLSNTRGSVYSDPGSGHLDPGRTGMNPDIGRWPANQILICECGTDPHAQGCPVGALDEQSGQLTSGKAPASGFVRKSKGGACYGQHTANAGTLHGDTGTASRFFYVAKVSAAERGDCAHPCMKPVELTTYIARLLLPPPRADGQPRRILVPFSGSGSEMVGAVLAGWDEVIGIELDAQWIPRAYERLAQAAERLLAYLADLAAAA
jgi:site-specific DNA-methyltransferase (adenine-specific)